MAFVKGQSGNPKGRAKGTRNQSTLMADALLDGDAQEIIATVVSLAKGGDMTAARIVLDRLIPPVKERPIQIDLPDTSTAAGISAAQSAILSAVANGDLLPGEANTMVAIVETRRRALETQELESRIAALEARGKE